MSICHADSSREFWQRLLLRDLPFTLGICLAIAFTTQTIWDGPLSLHIAISLGYGFSSMAGAYLLAWLLPSREHLLINLGSSGLAMIIGSLNAYWLLAPLAGDYILNIMRSVICLGVLFSLAGGFFYYALEQRERRLQTQAMARQREMEQERALLRSQLKQLQSQIEPHFLFNTLANIHALIPSAPVQAQQMLGQLTELLRGSLRQLRGDTCRLRDELAQLAAYLAIQQIRLGERLTFSLPGPGSLDELAIPPMLLQPLVENAIVHGIEPKASGGRVTIQASQEEGWLLLQVSDDGIGLGNSPLSGHGMALDNVRQRLAGLFGTEAALVVAQNPSGGVTASIRIRQSALRTLIKSNPAAAGSQACPA